MRKLASIRKINNVQPIPEADSIEAVQLDLWVCVAKKGEFKEGDLAVYYEIDAFLPATDERYKFLEKDFRTYEGKVGARLKTKKLRGQISQGLALPISMFPELAGKEEGEDITELLGITKWEPQIPAILSGQARGNFPSFIPKTDQERVQNRWRNYEQELEAESLWEVTEKVDGSSVTVYFNNGVEGVCSRNLDLKESEENAFWKTAKQEGIIDALKEYGKNLAIQGELYGPGIQGNSKKTDKLSIAIFDIWDIDKQEYLSPMDRMTTLFILSHLGLKALPVRRIFQGMIRLKMFPTFASLQDGIKKDKDTYEGWVFKRFDGKVSFKVISNDYLLKHSDR